MPIYINESRKKDQTEMNWLLCLHFMKKKKPKIWSSNLSIS